MAEIDRSQGDRFLCYGPTLYIHNAVGVAVARAHPKCRISLYHSAPPISLAADVHYAQMIELRRLARVRTKAMYGGDAAKVNRTQDRIKYLKWQIETNC